MSVPTHDCSLRRPRPLCVAHLYYVERNEHFIRNKTISNNKRLSTVCFKGLLNDITDDKALQRTPHF